MKSRIHIQTASHSNPSINTNSAFGFSRPWAQKFRCTTAMLIAAVAGILLTTPAVAGDRDDRDRDHDDHQKVDHVLLISVDGMHQSDLAWYVQTHPDSTLAKLMAEGVDFSNASTPFPSDSFPGMVGQVTGGNPSSTGIYYDDTWNHDVFPPGTTNCAGTAPGAEVTVPLDIEPAGPLQHNLLSRRELQFLARRQHVIEGDVGVEREFVGGADISADLLEEPIGLLRDRGRRSIRRRGRTGGSGGLVLRRHRLRQNERSVSRH